MSARSEAQRVLRREVTATAHPGEHAVAVEPAEAAPPAVAAAHAPGAYHERCSPDPCQHTDRYQLVTPFALWL